MHQAKLQPSQLDPRGERSRTYAWDDPAISAAAAREVAGEEFLTAILNGSLPAAPVARTLEFAPVGVEPRWRRHGSPMRPASCMRMPPAAA